MKHNYKDALDDLSIRFNNYPENQCAVEIMKKFEKEYTKYRKKLFHKDILPVANAFAKLVVAFAFIEGDSFIPNDYLDTLFTNKEKPIVVIVTNELIEAVKIKYCDDDNSDENK